MVFFSRYFTVCITYQPLLVFHMNSEFAWQVLLRRWSCRCVYAAVYRVCSDVSKEHFAFILSSGWIRFRRTLK